MCAAPTAHRNPSRHYRIVLVSANRCLVTSDDSRAAVKRWVDTWKRIGPILDAERWNRLAVMTDRQRASIALDLLSLWQPDRPGDDAGGLIRVQRAFALWRKKHL
jgi:hypothetical protein